MASDPPSPQPEVSPQMPPWVRRLAVQLGASVFLWFFGGFLLLNWLGREQRVAILSVWGVLLFAVNFGLWKLAGARDHDAAT